MAPTSVTFLLSVLGLLFLGINPFKIFLGVRTGSEIIEDMYVQLSRELSSSLQLSLDNPLKVIGRELFELKVTHLSRVVANKLLGKANL